MSFFCSKPFNGPSTYLWTLKSCAIWFSVILWLYFFSPPHSLCSNHMNFLDVPWTCQLSSAPGPSHLLHLLLELSSPQYTHACSLTSFTSLLRCYLMQWDLAYIHFIYLYHTVNYNAYLRHPGFPSFFFCCFSVALLITTWQTIDFTYLLSVSPRQRHKFHDSKNFCSVSSECGIVPGTWYVFNKYLMNGGMGGYAALKNLVNLHSDI